MCKALMPLIAVNFYLHFSVFANNTIPAMVRQTKENKMQVGKMSAWLKCIKIHAEPDFSKISR